MTRQLVLGRHQTSTVLQSDGHGFASHSGQGTESDAS